MHGEVCGAANKILESKKLDVVPRNELYLLASVPVAIAPARHNFINSSKMKG